MSQSNIYKFVLYMNRINAIFGMKIMNDDLQTASWNKIYGTIILSIILILMFLSTPINVSIFKENYHLLSLTVTYALCQISVILAILMIHIESLIFAFNYSRDIFNMLLQIDRKLDFEKTKQNQGIKTTIILSYVTYVLMKSIHIYFNLCWSLLHTMPYQLCCIIWDLQAIRFVLEVNFIARRFEVFNQNLTMYTKVEVEKLDGILIRIWRVSRNFLQDSNFKVNDKSVQIIVATHNELVRVVNKLNSRYSLMVGFICFLINQ